MKKSKTKKQTKSGKLAAWPKLAATDGYERGYREGVRQGKARERSKLKKLGAKDATQLLIDLGVRVTKPRKTR